MRGVILIAVALAAVLLAQFAYYLVLYRGQRRQADLKRRLQALSHPQPEGHSVLRERRVAQHRLLARVLDPLPGVERLEGLLNQTDLSLTVASVLGLSLLAAAAAAVGLWLVVPVPLVAVAGALAAATLPLTLLLNSRARRTQKLSSQLPDALDMMVRSLRAGHGLAAALRLVAQEMPLPVALEFGRCFEEQRLGVDLREAVRNLTLRVPDNEDLKIFAVSVIIQHDTGGNLVEILEQIATTIRERFKFYGKLRALTIESKLSAIVLGILPFVCLALVALLRPTYLLPLLHDRIGHLLVIGGVALWLVGAISMRRLARVDY